MSSVLDDKIVSMSFDNSKFDKNVQQSIETIDNLKNSLQFDEAKTSFAGLTKSANSVDLSGIEKSLIKLNKRFSAFGIASQQVITNLVNFAMKTAKKSTNWLTQGVIQGGINRAKNIQQAKFQLKGLGVEWSKIAGDIDYAVAGTAYGMDSAAKAASQLVASNVQLGDSMKTALRGISGLAAMTNSSYDDMARIFTTVAGNGRLMGDQLNQISSRGINAAATLGTYLGKTEKEVRDMVSHGQVDFETFAKAMDSAFGEHAKEANITFEGSMSNVRAALGRIGELFVTPLIEDNGPVVKFFNTLRLVIDNIKAAAAQVSGDFLNPVISAIQKATQWLRNLYHVTGDLFKRYENIIGDAGGSVAKFEETVKEKFKAQGYDVDKLVEKYGGLQSALQNISSKDRLKILSTSFQESTKIYGQSADTLESKTNKFIEVVNKYANGRKKITEGDEDFIKSIEKEGYAYSDLKDIIDKTLSGSKVSMEDWNKSQLKAIGASSTQIKLWRHWQNSAKMAGMSVKDYADNLLRLEKQGSGGVLILDTLHNVLKAILAPLQAIKKAFYNVFGGANNEIEIYNLIYALNQLSAKLIMSKETSENLTKTFEGLFTIIKVVAKILGGALKVALFFIGNFLKIAGNGALAFTSSLSELTDGLEKGVNKALAKTVSKLKEFISNIPVVRGLIETLQPAFKKVRGTLKAYLIDNGLLAAIQDDIRQKIAWHIKDLKLMAKAFLANSDVIKQLKSHFGMLAAIFNRLFGDGPKHIKLFLAAVRSLTNANVVDVQRLKNAFKENIIDYFFDAKKWKTLGKAVLKTFTLSLRDLANVVKTINFKGIGQAIFKKLSSVLNKLHKMKLIDLSKWKSVGASIIEGLLKGISGASNGLIKSAGNIGLLILDTVKTFLGIHSPSTKMIEIGEFIIQGLLIGLKNGIGSITSALKSMFSTVGSGVSNYLPKILSIVGAIKGLIILTKFAKTIKSFVSPIMNLTNAITGFIRNLSAVQKQLVKNLKAAVWVEYALAILIFANAIQKLGQMSLKEAGIGLGSLVILLGALTGFSLALSKVNDKELYTKILSLSVMMLVFGRFLNDAAKAFKKMTELDADGIENALTALGAIMIALIGFVVVASKLTASEKDVIKAQGLSVLLVAFGQSLLSLADAMRRLGKLKPDAVEQASDIILGFSAVISAMLLIMDKTGAGTGFEVAAVFAGFSAALLVLGFAMQILGRLDPKVAAQAYVVMTTFGLIAALVSAIATRLGGSGAVSAGVFLGFSASLLILSFAIKRLGSVTDGEVKHALQVISKFGLIVAGVMILSRLTRRAGSTAVVLLAFSSSFVILGKAIKLLASISDGEADRALSIITQFAAICMVMVAVTEFAGENAAKAGVFVLSMAGAMLVMAAAVGLLSLIKPGDMVRASLMLTVMLGALGVVMYSASKLDDKQSFKSLIVIAAAVGELMAAMVLLARCKASNVAIAGVVIAGVLAMLSVLCTQIKKVDSNNGAKVLAELAIIIGEVSGALIALANLPFKQVLAAGAAITGALLAFAVIIQVWATAMKAVMKRLVITLLQLAGVFALLMGIILGTFYVIKKFDLNPATETIDNICKLLLSFALVTTLLAALSVGAGAAVAGALAMDAVIAAVLGFIIAIGVLMEKVPAAEEFLNKGLDVLKRVGLGLGEVIGAIIGGVAKGATDALPLIGMNFSAFWASIKPFIDGLGGIDSKAAEGAKNLSAAILTITGAGVLDKILNWVGGGDALWKFSESAGELGVALTSFSSSIEGLSEKDIAKIQIAAKAVKALADFANAIPNEGGLWAKLAGDNNMSAFCKQFGDLGENLSELSGKIGNISEEDTTRIKQAASAAKALADFAKAIPNEGGMWAKLAGDNSLSEFSSKLPDFGKNLSEFSNSVKDVNAEAVTTAGKSIKSIVEALNNVDFKPANVSLLGTNIGSLGKGANDLYTSVSPIDVGKLAAFDIELKALVGIIKGMADMSGTEANGFKNAMTTLGSSGVEAAITGIQNTKDKLQAAISDLFSSISSSAKNSGSGLNFASSFKTGLTSALSTINSFKTKFQNAGKNVSSAFSTGFNNSKVSIGSGIKTSLSGCVSTINSFKGSFTSAGANVSAAFSNGFNNKKTSIGNGVTSALKSCLHSINSYKSQFSSAGKNMVQGFASGISSSTYIATARAKAMAKAAKDAAKKELDINSPSRVMMEVGSGFVEGFSKGIRDNAYMGEDSAASMAKMSMMSTLGIVSEINDIVNDNMDIAPVISPVIDTTNLDNGLSSLNTQMLNSGYAFGLGGSINIAKDNMEDMAATIVNGVKQSVKTLLDDMPSPTYTFNIPTNIDGRAVAQATATYTQDELDKLQARNNRQLGFI